MYNQRSLEYQQLFLFRDLMASVVYYWTRGRFVSLFLPIQMFFAYSDVASVGQSFIISNQRSLFQRYLNHFQEMLSKYISVSWKRLINIPSKLRRKMQKGLALILNYDNCFYKPWTGLPQFSFWDRNKRCMKVSQKGKW